MLKLTIIAFLSGVLIFSAAAHPAQAATSKDRDYDAVVNHLKSKYQAKKVKIPFLGLARFAMRFVKPAGVKSFNIAVFENLKLTENSDQETQAALGNCLSANWSPLVRVRSRDKAKVYLYMREDKKDIRILLVTLDQAEATVIRAKIDPDKILQFIDDPKILGISLGNKN